MRIFLKVITGWNFFSLQAERKSFLIIYSELSAESLKYNTQILSLFLQFYSEVEHCPSKFYNV